METLTSFSISAAQVTSLHKKALTLCIICHLAKLDESTQMEQLQNTQTHIHKLVTRPSFQEETGIVLALVFPSSSNRPLVFKAHACTDGLSHDVQQHISKFSDDELTKRRCGSLFLKYHYAVSG